MRFIFCASFLLYNLFSAAQIPSSVDFIEANAQIFVKPENKEVFGVVDFHVKTSESTDSIKVDAKNMKIVSVKLNNSEVEYRYDSTQVKLLNPNKQNIEQRLSIAFQSNPKKALYFVGWDNEAPNQVWTQGQGKYTSNWLPSIDDVNEKLIWNLSVTAPDSLQVIANGKLNAVSEPFYIAEKEMKRWSFSMEKPMSSYLVAMVIGEYEKDIDYSESGILLEKYYYPGDSLKVEPSYRYTKEMFDFLENEIGIAYPWQNYKQIPVHDFLYAGMENTGTTIFSDQYMIYDTQFEDFNYVNINAHELAHQWFGNMVTATSGTHHWLQEGFATYYALLAEKHIFGEDHFYYQLLQTAEQLEWQDKQGNSTILLDPNSNSLTFYQKGAWTLFMLRELIGDVAFRNSVMEYLDRFQFRNVSTEDFMSIVERNAEMDLTAFEDVWLNSDDFPYERAIDALKQNSSFIQEYLMVDCTAKHERCIDYLTSGISHQAKEKVIAMSFDDITEEVFHQGPKVRQYIAQYLSWVSPELKDEYESLLKDESYVTREAALYHLFQSFPEERTKYLQSTDGVGFKDYPDFRMLWIVLHLNTPEFQPERKTELLQELEDATSEAYNFNTRIKAFQILINSDLCREACIEALKKAQSHHSWQMVKFARNQLKRLDKR